MHVSLRSQMIAGTAALGAAAIALSPVAQPDLLPSLHRVSSPVQLSAISLVNPITAIGTVVQNLNTDIFNQGFISDTLIWGDFFSNPPAYDTLYAPLNSGIIPDLANQASTGTLAALVNNLSGYTWAGIRGAGVVAAGVAASAFNTPIALINAAQYLAAGNAAAAVAELQTQILGPLQQGFTGAFESIGYILDNVIRNVQTLVTITTPTLLSGLLNDWAIGGATYIVQSAIGTATAIVGSLATGDLQGAWTNAVNGFLGQYGTLGQIESLTVGVGIVKTDTTSNPPVNYVAVPSIRSVVNSVLQRTGGYADLGLGGITNNPLVPSPGPVAALPAKPAAAARVAAPAAETAAGDSAPAVDHPVAGADTGSSVATAVTAATESADAAADGGSAAPKVAKHGVSRKAAKAAADN